MATSSVPADAIRRSVERAMSSVYELAHAMEPRGSGVSTAMRQNHHMKLPAGHVRAFRKTFDISIEAYSHEEAQEYFRDRIGDIVCPRGSDVVIEDIYGFGHEPVRDSDRGIPLYPATATVAALTKVSGQAHEAFLNLVGSASFDIGHPELYFDAVEPGPVREGTIAPPHLYYVMKERRTLWAKIKGWL
jgi:hypothetical protein